MAVITSLPEELLLVIFNSFSKISQLAHCRLVCRAWRNPAERAMLGHTITISAVVAKMRSLYAFLQNDPAKTNLIKHLHINTLGLNYTSSSLFMELLQLALTPSIESIIGNIYGSERIIDELTAMAETYPNKFGRLKTLDLRTSRVKLPLTFALQCKDSIQTLGLGSVYDDIDIDWVSRRLNEFHHLTSFKLTAVIDFKHFDIIMDCCPQLKEVEFIPATFNSRYHAVDFNQQDVEQHSGLRVFRFDFDDGFACRFNVWMKYIIYKFINIEEIHINLYFEEQFRSNEERWSYCKEHLEAPAQNILHSLNRSDCVAKLVMDETDHYHALIKIERN